MRAGYRIGVDIGGTFTDFCVFDEATGAMRTLKTLSTPETPGAEVMNGIAELKRRYGQRPASIGYFTHGTTVGVNTVIQRRGAELALFTTREFEDVLEVARLEVPDPYDLFSRRAAPLAPRERVYGIAERTLQDGSIETPVDSDDVRAAVERARDDGADTIVVALLHAYANPANVRAPDQNWGDLKARISACNTGERKVLEMVSRFGVDVFREGVADLLDYAETQARAIVRALPDGTYPFADYMDEDAVDGWPCRLQLTLVIDGDELIFDFTGSDPQLESSLNIPTGGDERHTLLLVGMTYVLYSLDPSLYLNSGVGRVCRCILPSGTIVNPVFPAAVGMRSLSCSRLQGLIFGAFAPAAPDRLAGAPGSGGPIMNVNTTDNRTGRRIMAAVNPMTGGSDGRAEEDGQDGSGANQGFLKNTPTEVNEVEAGIKVLRYGLTPEMVFQAFAPNSRVTARNRDRTRFTGWGIAGGRAGGPSRFIKNPGTNREVDLGNTDILTIGPGDVIHVTCGGAGGLGDPLRRDPGAVLLDWRRGWVTTEHARDAYGVVIDEGAVDGAATRALRTARSNGDAEGFYDVGHERTAFESVWTEENYAALTECLASLPVHWRFYAKHRIFAAIDFMDPGERPGDGSEVHRTFEALRAEFPELAAAAAAD